MSRLRHIESLMGTTALVGAALALAAPAAAQDYGLVYDGSPELLYTNPLGTTLQGNLIGVYGRGGEVRLTNRGTVAGNDGALGAVVFEQRSSRVDNHGLIVGAGYGILTREYLNPQTGLLEPNARLTTVNNYGTIIGQTNDGARLVGVNSTVINYGVIEGRGSPFSDGVSMLPHTGLDPAVRIGQVSNYNTGSISGVRFGVILTGGGEVSNGNGSTIGQQTLISGGVGGVLIQSSGGVQTQTARVINSGFGGTIIGGTGVSFAGSFAAADIINIATITGTSGAGVLNDAVTPLGIDNRFTTTTSGSVNGTIMGATSGILAREGALSLVNAGIIRGNGTYDGFEATPDGGISIGVGGSSITNSGSITGARFGITTYNYYNAQTGLLEPRAVGTSVSNLAGGSIIGEGDDGVRLIGGGTVTNAGTIEGRNFLRADGVSMFALEGQDTTGQASIGTVNNQAGGTIFGNRFGIGLSGGGAVENAGTILASDFSAGTLDGFGGGILFQAGPTEVGKTGTLTNSGSISGGNGVLYGANLASGTLTNSGSITGTQAAGVHNTGLGAVTVDNLSGGSITGSVYGVRLANGGTVDNAGSISGTSGAILIEGQAADPGKIAIVNNSGTLGGGTGILLGGPGGNALGGAVITNSGTIAVSVSGPAIFSGFSGLTTISNLAGASMSGRNSGIIGRDGAIAVTNAGTIIGQAGGNNGGIVIEQAGSSVSNSGLIESFNFGVTANPYAGQPRAVGTVVDNSGTIRGLNNDGVRLQGGGTITNSGLIEGLASIGADGVSMFAHTGQDVSGLTSIGTVNNLAGGSIRGNRFGIILSTGGTVNNAGSIWAPDFNTQASSGFGAGIVIQDGTNSGGKTGTVSNSGTIIAGAGISFSANLTASTLSNSGSITGRMGDGVNNGSNTLLTIDNLAGGSISGGRSGIYSEFGALSLNNAGTIRSNGINSSFNRTDAGVVMVQAGSSVSNSGTISGAAFGITTAYFVDGNGVFSGLAIGTQVTNSGTIRGDSNDGVRLLGGGTVTNSGLIEGLNSIGSDGVSMFRYDDQDVSARPSIGTVINQAGGTIAGDRFGIILSGGGLIENDGTIRGNANGLLIQAGNALVPYTGTLINRGTIENGARFNDGLTASVTNSGTIRIDSPNTPALDSLAQISVVNTGTISSTGTHAIRFGLGNDLLTLGTGSQIVGISDGGAGLDILRLQSGAGVTQALGRFDGFETLETISGTWTVAGDSGAFDAIAITGGELILTGGIAGDVTTSGSGTFRLGSGAGVGGFTGDIVNDGNLLVDIGTNFDITGDFSGTGNFTKSGVGTVSFLGAYGFTGTTTLLAGGIRIAGAIDPQASFDLGGGTLDLSGSTGTTIAGLSGDAGSSVVLGSSSLTVNQDIDTVFAGNLSGTGSLIKDGDGRLNLTGTSSYTGPTVVSGGTLAVNGSIVSPVTIQSGATLGGTGTTGTVTIESGGTFNPGNSIGTIRVVGQLTFRSGSTFAVETSPTGSSDRINVTGRITIESGAAMSVLAGTGNYRPSTTYVVLTATDRVVGRFGSLSTDLAFLEPKLDYSSKKVELTLKRRSITFASVATTSSQAAVASAVESMGLYNPLHDAMLNQNVAGARAAFDTLSGGFYGQLSNQLLAGGSRLQEALQEGGDPVANGPHMWATALSGARTGSGPEYRSGVSLARDGLQVALVTGFLPFERLSSGERGTANVETHYSGAGVSYARDGWTVGTGFGMAWHTIEASRSVVYAGFADGARADFRARTHQAFGEVSYGADIGSLAVSSFAGLSTTRMSGAEITEIGGTAALSIQSRERQLNLATLGVRASGHLALPEGLRLIPRVELGWQWAGGSLGAMQSSRFLRNGAGFNIVADELATSGLTADIGLELQMGKLSLLGSYQRSAVSRDVANGAELGLRMRF